MYMFIGTSTEYLENFTRTNALFAVSSNDMSNKDALELVRDSAEHFSKRFNGHCQQSIVGRKEEFKIFINKRVVAEFKLHIISSVI